MVTQKRIVSIEIDNFRAYHGAYPVVDLSNGENLLIYGENGSGKSSLFKALNNYFSSSITTLDFIKNRYLGHAEGKISITFDDFTLGVKANTPISFQFSSTLSSNTQPFIQNAAIIKGFLDYTSLLDIYFHKGGNPNLFNLIVLGLLADHIPSASGGNYKLKSKWEELQKDLIENAYNRNDRCHQNALAELPNFEIYLRGTLTRVFTELNRLLQTYFNDLSLEIDFELESMTFFYGSNKKEWKTPAQLFLKIKRDGVLLNGKYNDYLNEARLSAFAICIYLSSLKLNPSNIELKVLYLDDIFIGLDAANRIPILEILKKEFVDYQIFLSTYDRHTYEVARRSFSTISEQWKSIELYVGNTSYNGISFDKPIILISEDNYKRAMFFLHHPEKPDYPAAANYFRKHAEEILTHHLPPHEIREDDFSLISGYQLSKLINAGIKFLEKVGFNTTLLSQLKNFLPTLLHPLSHFNLSSPIYKKELFAVQNLLLHIQDYLIKTVKYCKPTLHSKHFLTLNIKINNTLTHKYTIKPKEMIYIIEEPGQIRRMSSGICYCSRMCQTDQNGIESNIKELSPNIDAFQYASIKESYEKIFAHNQNNHNGLIISPNFTDNFSVHIEGVNKQLAELL